VPNYCKAERACSLGPRSQSTRTSYYAKGHGKEQLGVCFPPPQRYWCRHVRTCCIRFLAATDGTFMTCPCKRLMALWVHGCYSTSISSSCGPADPAGHYGDLAAQRQGSALEAMTLSNNLFQQGPTPTAHAGSAVRSDVRKPSRRGTCRTIDAPDSSTVYACSTHDHDGVNEAMWYVLDMPTGGAFQHAVSGTGEQVAGLLADLQPPEAATLQALL
jgi:hypothetical protein